jgi:hypothetical protein
MGYDRSDFAGKPVIAIVDTWSDINPCHTRFKQRVEEVLRVLLHVSLGARDRVDGAPGKGGRALSREAAKRTKLTQFPAKLTPLPSPPAIAPSPPP